MDYKAYKAAQEAEAQAWAEVNMDKLEAVISPERFGDGHVVTESLDDLTEDDVPYVGLNGGGSHAHTLAMQDVHRLEHWQGDRCKDESGAPIIEVVRDEDGMLLRGPVGAKQARYQAGRTLIAPKFEAHCKRAQKRQRYHGLEFLISANGKPLASTRPSTMAKVRMAYREQVKSESPDINAPKVAKQADFIKACMIAIAHGGIHRVMDTQGFEDSQYQLALKTGLPRRWKSITDPQVERCPVDRTVDAPVNYALSRRQREYIATAPLYVTFRARLARAFRKQGIQI